MKFLGKAVLALFCLAATLGSTTYANFNMCCPEGNIYVEVDGLYWKPMHCPIFVARRFQSGNSEQPRPRDELYLKGDYEGGVRARVGYQMCNWFSDLSYLHFCSTDNEKQRRGDDFDRMLIAGSRRSIDDDVLVISAKSRASFRYQNVDGRLGHSLCQCGDLRSYLYANARWVKIDFKNLTTGVPDDDIELENFMKQDSHFKGGGLGLGLGGEYAICGGFRLKGNAGLMAIIGETELNNYSNRSGENGDDDPQENFLSKSEEWCHILPAIDFKLGIDYTFCCGCRSGTVEVGYELHHYSKALRYASDNLIPPSASAEIPLFSCQDIGFAGPYIAFSFDF